MKFKKCTGALSGIVILLTISLGGCLSEKDSISSADGDPVVSPNNAPTISGSPQSAVMMGDGYSFVPTAGDPDGDTLTFSSQNLPSWASFDSTNGSINGNPSLADVGLFDQIIITVSDGTDSASLTAFSIEVSQVSLGSMTLSWTPPTQNTDGSTLTDLAGYRIYYGNSDGNYPNRIIIDTPGLATYVVENLVSDTYYVVATSVNSLGIESSNSNSAIKVVN